MRPKINRVESTGSKQTNKMDFYFTCELKYLLRLLKG